MQKCCIIRKVEDDILFSYGDIAIIVVWHHYCQSENINFGCHLRIVWLFFYLWYMDCSDLFTKLYLVIATMMSNIRKCFSG